MNRTAAIALCLTLLGTLPAGADLPAAIEAYDQGDYATAFEESIASAEQGDPDAQYMLGYLYWRGEGVRRDPVRAYLWFALAARQGDDVAADAAYRIMGGLSAEQRAEAEALIIDRLNASE